MRMGGVHSLWQHHSGVTIMRWSVVSKIRDLSARNRDRCLMRCAAPRNNTLCIRTEVRGIPAADHLESLQRIHVGVQGTGCHPPIQGDSQVGRVPGSQVFTVVLVCEAAFPTSNSTLLYTTHAGEPRPHGLKRGVIVMSALFPLGQIVATPGALAALERPKQPRTCFLARHAIGDWGELEPTDVAENKYSLIHGFRLLSSY
jgi:hypothetical protein